MIEWSTTRQHRLDKLLAAHQVVTGGRVGRRTLAEGLNRALIVRLASEFQGFSRDLHDNAIEALQIRVASDPVMGNLFASLAVAGRKLDSGNATWGNINNDFGRLGINVAARLRARYPREYPVWVGKLERLNRPKCDRAWKRGSAPRMHASATT